MNSVKDPPAIPATSQIGTEFAALPLEFLISAPLTGAVKAQKAIADTTLAFIEASFDKKVTFEAEIEDATGTHKRKIVAPLLTVVPIPNLRIDSLTNHFKFEITHAIKQESATKADGSLSGELKNVPWLSFSVKGSIAHSSSQSEIVNRSGVLEVTVHASEAEMPAGLSKVLTWLTASIQEQPA